MSISNDVFCPLCGSFVETVASLDEKMKLECDVCGHKFDFEPEQVSYPDDEDGGISEVDFE